MHSPHLSSMRDGGQLCGSAWVCVVTRSLATVVAVIALVMCRCRCRSHLVTGGSACMRERTRYPCNLRGACPLRSFAPHPPSLSPFCSPSIVCHVRASVLPRGAPAAEVTVQQNAAAARHRRVAMHREERERPRERPTPRRVHNREGGGDGTPSPMNVAEAAGNRPTV